MSKIEQFSRILQHRSTTTGDIPTVAPSTDHTDGTWDALDLYVGELFINTADDTIYFRSDNGIVEIQTSISIDPCWEYSGTDIITKYSNYSPLTYPNILPQADNQQSLGNNSTYWSSLYTHNVYAPGDANLLVQGLANIILDTSTLTFKGITGTYTGSELITVQAGIDTYNSNTERLITLPTSSDNNYWIEAYVVGRDNANTSTGIGGSIMGVFCNNGGTLTQIGTTTSTIKNSYSGGTFAFVISGQDVEVQVTGPGSNKTLSWVTTVRYQAVGTAS